jgi:hypothetical protein
MSKEYILIFLCFFSLSCNKPKEQFDISSTRIEETNSSSANSIEIVINFKGKLSQLKKIDLTVTDNLGMFSKSMTISAGASNKYTVSINGLINNKIYQIKAFAELIDNSKTQLETQEFEHFYDERWERLPLPEMTSEEYILGEQTLSSNILRSIRFTKVRPPYDEAVHLNFYPGFDGWNLSFRQENPVPFKLRYNEIQANFKSRAGRELQMVGAGHQLFTNGTKLYLKDIQLLGLDGYKYDPSYPGDNVETSSFGFKNNVYVVENKPFGKIWIFDYEEASWRIHDQLPFDFPAFFSFLVTSSGVFAIISPIENAKTEEFLYEYSIESKSWKTIIKLPFEPRIRVNSIVYKNTIYVGGGQNQNNRMGRKDFFSFDPENKIWKKAFVYPGQGNIHLAMAVYSNSLYVGFGKKVLNSNTYLNSRDFWRVNF